MILLRDAIRHLLHWLDVFLRPPIGSGARDAVALFSIGTGIIRLLPLVIDPKHVSAQPVNILPAPVYGALLFVFGMAMLLTNSECQRAHWHGQVVATFVAGLWLLLALDVMNLSLASAYNAALIAALAINEVRVHDC